MVKANRITKLPCSPDTIKQDLASTIGKKLNKKDFPYHNWEDHVMLVYRDVETLGKKIGVSKYNTDLLKIAALYHEVGLVEGKTGHERRSEIYARKELAGYGFSESDIASVKKLIAGTEARRDCELIAYKPTNNILVKIIRDADVAHLGKRCFRETNDQLRRECGEKDKKAWLKMRLKILKAFRFQTKQASQLWGEGLQNNRKYIETCLKRLA